MTVRLIIFKVANNKTCKYFLKKISIKTLPFLFDVVAMSDRFLWKSAFEAWTEILESKLLPLLEFSVVRMIYFRNKQT